MDADIYRRAGSLAWLAVLQANNGTVGQQALEFRSTGTPGLLHASQNSTSRLFSASKLLVSS